MGSLLSNKFLVGALVAFATIAAANRVDFTRRILNG